MKKIYKDKTGLTLVEIVVAMVILALTITGLFAVFVSGKRIISRSRRRLIAVNFARQKAEELRSAVRQDTYDTGNLYVGAHSTNFLPATSELVTKFSGMGNYMVSNIAIDPSDPGNPSKQMREVDITVTWNEPNP